MYSIKEHIELLLVKFNNLASSFPEVITACFLFLTLPVTTATAERSFSKLKLIKNYLRTSMRQERLSDLSLLSIEAEKISQYFFSFVKNLYPHIRAPKQIFYTGPRQGTLRHCSECSYV